MKIPSTLRNKWAILAGGLVLGALVVLAIRFATYTGVPHAHYHANFSVYINGVQQKFADPTYYTEISACTTSGAIKPEQRAHMHDNVNSVAHVHDDGVTWGQFFENLNWFVGSDFIQTRDGHMYKADDANKLHIILNGEDYTGLAAITNQVIGDRDRLLVSYGDLTDAELHQEYKAVPSTAKHYDESHDPASCAGAMNHVTLSDRLHHLF